MYKSFLSPSSNGRFRMEEGSADILVIKIPVDIVGRHVVTRAQK